MLGRHEIIIIGGGHAGAEAAWAAARMGIPTLMVSMDPAAIGRRDDEIRGRFETLPESDWVASLPGTGLTLGPALLACFGRDARRFTQAKEAQALMGTAPVTRASGKSRSVHMRRAECDCGGTALSRIPGSLALGALFGRRGLDEMRRGDRTRRWLPASCGCTAYNSVRRIP